MKSLPCRHHRLSSHARPQILVSNIQRSATCSQTRWLLLPLIRGCKRHAAAHALFTQKRSSIIRVHATSPMKEEKSSKKPLKGPSLVGKLVQGTVSNIHPQHGVFVEIEGYDSCSGLINFDDMTSVVKSEGGQGCLNGPVDGQNALEGQF
jgi:hypothetical protein